MALPETSPLEAPEGSAAFRLRLDPDLPAFQGHFPGDPILPGVVQVDWAIRLAVRAFGPLGPFRGLDRIKFLEPLRPGDVVELRLSRPGPGKVAFRYRAGQGPASNGELLFGDGP